MSANILHSSESVEWYTPAPYIEAARELMGGIDLDPASSAIANKTVKAARFYTSEDNGLSQEWRGRVFCNPPYGKTGGISNQHLWASKARHEFSIGRMYEGVLLINATPDRSWFKPLWTFPICFTDHRIKFLLPSGKRGAQPTHGSALVYFGPLSQWARFATLFVAFGHVIFPELPGSRAVGGEPCSL